MGTWEKKKRQLVSNKTYSLQIFPDTSTKTTSNHGKEDLQNLRRNKLFGKGWERKREKKILTNWLVLLCTFPGDQELLVMQQHSALEKSERAKRQGRKEERREGRWGKGRRNEERGGEMRKGEGTACTHCVCWTLTLLLGKKKTKLPVNPAGCCFAMAQDDKGRRS